MELFPGEDSFDAFAHMVQALQETRPEPVLTVTDVIEELRNTASIESWGMDSWLAAYGVEEAVKLHAMNIDGRALFSIIAGMIPALPELVEAIEKHTELLCQWLARHEKVKELSTEAFDALMTAKLYGGTSNLKHGSVLTEMGYRVLRHSTRTTEHRYVARVSYMKHHHAERTIAPGGKLHTMASQYPKWERYRP